MRRILGFVLTILMLFGCSGQNEQMELALHFRDRINNSSGCSFDVSITADYQDTYYTFGMSCTADADGNLTFHVTAPDSISGITGMITSKDGKLTFDDKALLFSTLAEGQITPVSAPWLFLNTLKSGYIKACTNDKGGILLKIDDSYAEDAMTLNIRIVNSIPSFAEIFWQGRRVVAMDVKSFRIL